MPGISSLEYTMRSSPKSMEPGELGQPARPGVPVASQSRQEGINFVTSEFKGFDGLLNTQFWPPQRSLLQEVASSQEMKQASKQSKPAQDSKPAKPVQASKPARASKQASKQASRQAASKQASQPSKQANQQKISEAEERGEADCTTWTSVAQRGESTGLGPFPPNKINLLRRSLPHKAKAGLT